MTTTKTIQIPPPEQQQFDPKKRIEYIKNLKDDKEIMELEAAVEEADARIWVARVTRMQAQARYSQMTTPPQPSGKETKMMEEFEAASKNQGGNLTEQE
jgi:hypothetical protein